MRSFARSFSALIAGAIMSGASLLAQDVHVTYSRDFAFNQVKSYSWAKVETTDPLVEPRLTAAVDHILQGLGWRLVERNASIQVSAVESDNARGYTRFYRSLSGYSWQRGWGNGGFADETASPRAIHPGTMVIDMYDPADKKLIWRATASEPATAKEKTKQDDIDKAVHEVFASFPPKSGGPMAPNQVEVPGSNGAETSTGLRP